MSRWTQTRYAGRATAKGEPHVAFWPLDPLSLGVLNIGKLGPGAAEYYVGEVASSAEDYYTGRGEAQGRWVGSLRDVLGLEGEVDPLHFRRLLAGEQSAHGGAARVVAGVGGSGLDASR